MDQSAAATVGVLLIGVMQRQPDGEHRAAAGRVRHRRPRRRAARPARAPATARRRARPTPRVGDESAWVKRSKTVGRNSGSMPGPVSRTVMHAWSLVSSVTSTLPPRGVNLIALASRCQTTWRRRLASPRTTAGTGPVLTFSRHVLRGRGARDLRHRFGRAPSPATRRARRAAAGRSAPSTCRAGRR